MTYLQYLLNKLAEEASEVAQIALKTAQFGPDERLPGQPLNNFSRCHIEIDHFHAQVAMLNELFDFGYAPNQDAIAAKKLKVEHYAQYAHSLGMVGPVIKCAEQLPYPDPAPSSWMDRALAAEAALAAREAEFVRLKAQELEDEMNLDCYAALVPFMRAKVKALEGRHDTLKNYNMEQWWAKEIIAMSKLPGAGPDASRVVGVIKTLIDDIHAPINVVVEERGFTNHKESDNAELQG